MDRKEPDIDSRELDECIEEDTLDLESVRKSRGLTLGDISHSTRVSCSNLKAIEEQAFELLPEPIYARAFICAYADAIDIDGKEILSLYDRYLEGREEGEDKNEILKKLAGRKRRTGLWIWLIIISCLLVLAGVFSLYQRDKDNESKENGLSTVEEAYSLSESVPAAEVNSGHTGENSPSAADGSNTADAVETPDRNAVGNIQPANENEQKQEAGNADEAAGGEYGPYKLTIQASEATWIRITKDNGPSFEVLLRPGDVITEETSKKFGLIIGNAAGVNIRFNGMPVDIKGKHGEVVYMTLPAGG